MQNKTVIVLTPYLNYPAALHVDDCHPWHEHEFEKILELRDQLLELDLPGIELLYLGDSPEGHPVHVELIDENFAAGQVYLDFRKRVTGRRNLEPLSIYVKRALDLHHLKISAGDGK